jgi:hypothetical protein
MAMVQTYPTGELGPLEELSEAEIKDRMSRFPDPSLENLMARELKRWPVHADSLGYPTGSDAPGYPPGTDPSRGFGQFRPWA